jgi:hypothetical protein
MFEPAVRCIIEASRSAIQSRSEPWLSGRPRVLIVED